MPTSSKLVIFDTQLHVKKAFHALVYNNVRAAPLWDNEKQKFVGMLTITDFIRILICYYKSQMEQLEEQRIQTWREVLTYRDNFVHISPEASLFDAIKMLIENRIHRLPLVHPNTGDVLCIFTHKRLLKYLYLSDASRPQYMESSIGELNIGTRANIVTVSPDTKVIEALKLFIQHAVSAFPVIESTTGRCVDIFSKFDVIHLANDRSYDNLDISIMKVLERRKLNQTTSAAPQTPDANTQHTNGNGTGTDSSTGSPTEAQSHNATSPQSEPVYPVVKCKLSNSFNDVIDLIAKAEVHRLVIVDDSDQVIGMISLSDILNYLILKHPETASQYKASSCHTSSSSVDSFEKF